MSLRNFLVQAHWLMAAQFGFDPRRAFRSMLGVPRFIKDLRRFRSRSSERVTLRPCLHDWYEESGALANEYFWQDLLVARCIFESKPHKHVDVGSRVDGFVAHVASFREIEVLDVRPTTLRVPGVVFRQADLMDAGAAIDDYCDSLSCLHALEHFGLGRYGDAIDPQGFEHGFANMSRMLKRGGIFYLSVPIGTAKIEFNANRIFDPKQIMDLAGANALKLRCLTIIRNGSRVDTLSPGSLDLSSLAAQSYVLGVFQFVKHA